MKRICSISGLLLACLLAPGFASFAHASQQADQFMPMYTASTLQSTTSFAAMPRWWDDMVQWFRSIGWDRSRLVQMWLFFMLVGLFVILRIKPRS